MKRCLRRFLCAFLAVLLVCQEASAGVEVASSSDAMYGDDSSGLLAGVTDEAMERYYQSFIDYPVTLLEWPEEVPRPRFAVAALGAAAVYVLEVLAVAVGIYFVGVALDNLWKIYQNYEMTLRLEGKEPLLATWQEILSAQWGQAISGMDALYKDFKAYCKGSLGGYGTGAPQLSYSDPTVGVPVTSDHTYNNSYFGVKNVTSPVYFYFSYPSSFTSGYCSVAVMIVSKTAFDVTFSSTANGADYCYFSGSFTFGVESVNEMLSDEHMSFFGYDMSYRYIKNLVTLNESYYTGEAVAVTPDKQWGDVQDKEYGFSPTLNVPASQAEADDVLAKVSAAENAADVSKALEKTWDMGDAATDEEEKAYPWVPSITGWLEGIKSGIDSIKEKVMSIPDTLAEILNSILAIPGQIADFFTLDTTVISAEFTALQDVFAAKFGGISLLADVFTKSYSFDMTVPVFTVPVPETLREMFGGQSEIVIMDLRPHTELFLQLRSLLVAMFWVAFAKWLLDQFDVKFHVG